MNLKSYLLANTALFRWSHTIVYDVQEQEPQLSTPHDFSSNFGFDFASFRHHEHVLKERIPRRR